MRWPWQRAAEPAPGTPAPAAGPPGGPNSPAGPSPGPAGWAFLPPLQRTVRPARLISRPDAFTDDLASWHAPAFTQAMSHLVDARAPSGVIDGDRGGLGVPAPYAGGGELTLPPPHQAAPVQRTARRGGGAMTRVAPDAVGLPVHHPLVLAEPPRAGDPDHVQRDADGPPRPAEVAADDPLDAGPDHLPETVDDGAPHLPGGATFVPVPGSAPVRPRPPGDGAEERDAGRRDPARAAAPDLPVVARTVAEQAGTRRLGIGAPLTSSGDSPAPPAGGPATEQRALRPTPPPVGERTREAPGPRAAGPTSVPRLGPPHAHAPQDSPETTVSGAPAPQPTPLDVPASGGPDGGPDGAGVVAREGPLLGDGARVVAADVTGPEAAAVQRAGTQPLTLPAAPGGRDGGGPADAHTAGEAATTGPGRSDDLGRPGDPGASVGSGRSGVPVAGSEDEPGAGAGQVTTSGLLSDAPAPDAASLRTSPPGADPAGTGRPAAVAQRSGTGSLDLPPPVGGPVARAAAGGRAAGADPSPVQRTPVQAPTAPSTAGAPSGPGPGVPGSGPVPTPLPADPAGRPPQVAPPPAGETSLPHPPEAPAGGVLGEGSAALLGDASAPALTGRFLAGPEPPSVAGPGASAPGAPSPLQRIAQAWASRTPRATGPRSPRGAEAGAGTAGTDPHPVGRVRHTSPGTHAPTGGAGTANAPGAPVQRAGTSAPARPAPTGRAGPSAPAGPAPTGSAGPSAPARPARTRATGPALDLRGPDGGAPGATTATRPLVGASHVHRDEVARTALGEIATAAPLGAAAAGAVAQRSPVEGSRGGVAADLALARPGAQAEAEGGRASSASPVAGAAPPGDWAEAPPAAELGAPLLGAWPGAGVGTTRLGTGPTAGEGPVPGPAVSSGPRAGGVAVAQRSGAGGTPVVSRVDTVPATRARIPTFGGHRRAAALLGSHRLPAGPSAAAPGAALDPLPVAVDPVRAASAVPAASPDPSAAAATDLTLSNPPPTVAPDPATAVVQDPATAVVQDPAPAVVPDVAPTTATAVEAAAAPSGDPTEAMEKLADQLIEPIVRRLRAQLLVDRERRGIRTDVR